VASANRSTTSAFTLIELLIVIIIVALLVTLLLPSLQRAKLLAVLAVCGNDLRSIGAGSRVYASENNEYPPPSFRQAGAATEPGLTSFEGSLRDRIYGPGTVWVVDHGANLKEDGWTGIGRLVWTKNAVPQMGFCPSLSGNDRGSASHEGVGMQGTWGGYQRLMLSGYNVRYRIFGSGTSARGARISEYPGGWAFMFDRLMGLGFYPTMYEGDDAPPAHWELGLMNWARVDGSVSVHEYQPEVDEWYETGPMGSASSTAHQVLPYLKEYVDQNVPDSAYD